MTAAHFTSYPSPNVDGETILSVFIGARPPSLTELDSELASHVQRLGSIADIRFVGHREVVYALRENLRNPEQALAQRLFAILGPNTGAKFIVFDAATGTHAGQDWRGVSLDDGAIEAERRLSLTTVFQQAGGEERAPTGTHYSKTSTSHSNRFLRVSNVLERFHNVQLLAYWLLPRLWTVEGGAHIITDTSGIFSVLLEALGQLRRLGHLPEPEPRLWSHRSHEGVADIPRAIANAATFVISASTSNRLAKRLVDQGARATHITTLFELINEGVAKPVPGAVALCDLAWDGRVGIEPIINHDAASCPDCQRNFHLIAIRGDQFSISPPRVTRVDIKAIDLLEHKSVLAGLFGLRAFFAFKARLDSRLSTVGLDVRCVIVGAMPEKSVEWLSRIRTRWAAATRRTTTTTLRTVVACSYPASDSLAHAIQRDAAGRLGAAAPTVVPSNALTRLEPQPETSTVVVSACIDEHQELLSVSRALRDVQPGGATAYLSVAQLISPPERAKRLKTNLTMGALGAETFSYFSCFDLPVDTYEEEPSWKAELTELQRVSEWLDEREIDIPPEITSRIARLQAAPAEGLVDDLFWPDLNGQPLALRSDFALVEGALRSPVATQADLFASVCVALTNLRNHSDPSRRLTHNAYERAVLSPSNFDRYNDGVLQASILRAAHPVELAFGACEEDLSEDMLRVLMDALPDVGRPERSEALHEFIVAMLTGRLTLLPSHASQYAEILLARCANWPLAATLARYLQDKLHGA